jgi:leucyl aminopeptidase
LTAVSGLNLLWAHIDIAGTATLEKGPSGGTEATGFGVRLVLDYLTRLD